MKQLAFPPIAVCSILLLSGCGINSRVGNKLAEHAAVQQKEFNELLAGYDDVAPKRIGWKEAHKRLLRDNQNLRQSSLQLEKARKLKIEKWKSLVPQIASYVNIGTSINELTDLQGDDLNARLIASLSIPNPIRFYASLYAAAMQAQGAEWSNELDNRRAYAELYRVFVQSGNQDVTEAQLNERKQALLDLPNEEIAEALEKIRSEEESLRLRRTYLRQHLNRLFNTPGANWRPRQDMPSISYASKVDSIRVGENFGKLALNLQAIQLESGILRLRQVKLQQWPQFNFSLGLPTLYSNQGEDGFDAQEIFLFTGATKRVDLTDIGGLENIKDARQRLEFLRDRLRINVESETVRIRQLARSYRQLQQNQVRLRQQSAMIDRRSSISPETVLEDLSQRRELDERMAVADDRLLQLDLQFLIWDETYWK